MLNFKGLAEVDHAGDLVKKVQGARKKVQLVARGDGKSILFPEQIQVVGCFLGSFYTVVLSS